jgi:hypothetical protein
MWIVSPKKLIVREMVNDMGKLGGAKEGLKKVIHKIETS